MIEIQEWMKQFTAAIEENFAGRVVCIGLQGSYGRGEASDDSDIDVVVILNELNYEDLQKYDAVISDMPYRELICGFVSGKKELENWEKSDLFQFYYDTVPFVGNLDFLRNRIDIEAVRRAVRIGACNIYHMCVHNLLHEKDTEILRGLYKTAGFTIQAVYYKNSGRYIKKKQELAEWIPEEDKTILDTGNYLKKSRKISVEEFQEFSRQLLEWSGNRIGEYSEQKNEKE